MMRPQRARLVEVDAAGQVWFKSSRSSDDENDCVELTLSRESVLVRSSRDRTGPRLAFPAANWTAFLSSLRRDTMGDRTCAS